MNDLHFVKRARLRLCCLAVLVLFAGASLMCLLAIPAQAPTRSMLIATAGILLIGMLVSLLEAMRLTAELERENLEDDESEHARDWEQTKADLAALHRRDGRT